MDNDLHRRIEELVAEEHALRRAHADGSGLTPDEQTRLRGLEESLDVTWDLLRQRAARRDAGLDADDAAPRSADVVEHYLG